MTEATSNSRRIAKNTLVLYFRMFVLMLVSLYTSRVVLGALGVENYGIQNVVAGFVSMTTFLTGSLSSAVSRFMTYGLGKGDMPELRKIFSSAVSIQVIMSAAIILILETAGLWFVNGRLNIPPERLNAAGWVYQFSILAFVLGLLNTPFNAAIVAHEKMSVFAYISIFEAICKLVIAFLLKHSPFDVLVFYSLLMVTVSLAVRLISGIYCKRKFEECRKYSPSIDKEIFKSMFSFAGWNFFGNTAFILNTHGVNILMNIFFGVATNAARGIARQVESVISQFTTNFMTAVNPQITKAYASGDTGYMHNLIRRSTKFSYYLLLFIAIPLFLETESVLKIWLGNVPEHAVAFTRLSIISSLVMILGSSMYTAIMATGNIRKYQIIVTFVGCWVFPLTYIGFLLDMPPEAAYIIYIIIYLILIFIRIFLARQIIGLDAGYFIRKIILTITAVTLAASVVPFLVHTLMEMSFLRLVVVTAVSILYTAAVIYVIGLDKNEKNFIILKSKEMVLRIKGNKRN